MKNIKEWILLKLGFLTPCCKAKYVWNWGYNYKEDGYVCSECLTKY